MKAGHYDVLVVLAEQRRHQVRLSRKRMPWWLPLIFVTGLCVSIIGLIPFIAMFRENGTITFSVLIFALPALFFGWVVISWVLSPFLLSPRIVPYFARELGPLWGNTMAAFTRGRGLYLNIVALEQLAGTLGVKPLSTFGFAYDYYEQEVHWHPAAEGLRTVEALRQGLGADLQTAPGVARDLEALASVLRAAADRNVDFSLVLRLHAQDSIQGVCTREARQGSFW